MTLDIVNVMESLSRERRIFYSERDFQHALAWRIREMLPECQPRLEFPFSPESPFPTKRLRLDIWLAGARIAIELKYRTRKLNQHFLGEHFELRDQSAQDTGRYDFIRDIAKLERVTESPLSATAGFAVMLTNDPLYWEPPAQGGATANDAAFRLEDGRMIEGEMAWSDDAAPGTKKGREQPLRLNGRYKANWRNYWDFREGTHSEFRYLAVEVPAPRDKPPEESV